MSNLCGDMLRLARQRLGVTQKAAAVRLDVLQPVLSRFENGVSNPDAEFLLKASQIYNVPQSFFDVRDTIYGPPVSIHPMLRGRSEVVSRDIDLITAELNIRLIHLRKFLEGVDFEPINNLPLLDVEQYGAPEKIASTVRSHLGVPSGPIKNLMQIVERAGVVVGLSKFGGALVSGATFRVFGYPPVILLNATQPSDRMRFTLAHELGHLVMHRFPTTDMEDEANEFASALLMPANDIRPAFTGRKIDLKLLAALKPEWKVSMQALLMRASSLGFLTSNQSRYLWRQVSARGWRLNEPADLDFPTEEPSVLSSMIKSHLSGLGYSVGELAANLRMHESEFVGMYGSFSPSNKGKSHLRVVK